MMKSRILILNVRSMYGCFNEDFACNEGKKYRNK